jgi:hypothetical protein
MQTPELQQKLHTLLSPTEEFLLLIFLTIFELNNLRRKSL